MFWSSPGRNRTNLFVANTETYSCFWVRPLQIQFRQFKSKDYTLLNVLHFFGLGKASKTHLNEMKNTCKQIVLSHYSTYRIVSQIFSQAVDSHQMTVLQRAEPTIYVCTRRHFYVFAVHPLKGNVCVLLLAVMVSISGGFMKLRIYKCQRRVNDDLLCRTIFSSCPTNQIVLLSLLTTSHGVCHSLPARLVLLAGLPPSVFLCSSYGRLRVSRQTGMFGLLKEMCV